MIRYFDEEPVFKPSSCVRPFDGCPKVALITWHPGIAKKVKAFGAKKILTFHGGTAQDVFSISYKGKKFVFAHIAQGGPNAAAFIEELKVFGVEKFVFIGYCGVLDKTVGTKLIVPVRALRDEGTSYHYINSEDEFIEIESSAKVMKFLSDNKVPFVSGTTWTTDAAYRETPGAVRYAKEKGCICVEMECAGVMAVAKYLGIECYQMLFTADILSESEWESGRLLKFESDSTALYSEIALDFCLSLQA